MVGVWVVVCRRCQVPSLVSAAPLFMTAVVVALWLPANPRNILPRSVSASSSSSSSSASSPSRTTVVQHVVQIEMTTPQLQDRSDSDIARGNAVAAHVVSSGKDVYTDDVDDVEEGASLLTKSPSPAVDRTALTITAVGGSDGGANGSSSSSANSGSGSGDSISNSGKNNSNSSSSGTSGAAAAEDDAPTPVVASPLRTGLSMMWHNPPVMWLSLINSLNSFCNGSILVMLVMMFSLPVTEGGYGLSPFGSGAALSFFGATSFTFQVPVALSGGGGCAGPC